MEIEEISPYSKDRLVRRFFFFSLHKKIPASGGLRRERELVKM